MMQSIQLEQLAPELSATLVRALARIQSPWLPARANWRQGPAIYAARTTAEDDAIAPGKGAGDRQRKADQRIRDELIAMGLLARTRRLFGAQVTAAGRRLARAWTWPFSSDDLATAMERIQERVAAGDHLTGNYVPEPFIAGAAWGGAVEPFVELQNCFLPALCDGFVESGSSMEGHVSYRLCNVESIDAVVKECVGDELAFDAELSQVYVDALSERRKQILTDSRHYCEIGEFPLPVGVSVKSGREYSDLAGISPLFPNLETA